MSQDHDAEMWTGEMDSADRGETDPLRARARQGCEHCSGSGEVIVEGLEWVPYESHSVPCPTCARVEAALLAVERETIQQDAKWMRHKPDCDVWLWESGYVGVTFSQKRINPKQICSCGLADRLKEIER